MSTCLSVNPIDQKKFIETILEISDQDMFYLYLEEKINRGYLQAIPSFKIDRTEILNYFPECWN